ncbi:protein kinase [Streptomyces sp. NPDC056883]|uniref:protein kinase domain-containing protein n=1 Tax=Streptomyces sp. NPDC056883 TaxID=3345959 RepID=UPI003674CA37
MGEIFEQGETLAGGRYRIDGTLGSGGMALVYHGWDTRLSRAVAVKTMRPELSLDEGYSLRFRREAQAMAALAHPNVVTVHDTGEEPRVDGPPVPYFVMELVTGRSLADRLRTEGALPVAEAARIADQVLAALAVSHERGMVHRDIKPANVLLAGSEDTVKVADFGIVRAMVGDDVPLTGTRMMVGTPQYMSPEQVRGLEVDGRSDLYAVGVLLFEMLTGRVPFDGEDGYVIGYRHVTEPPPTLASHGIFGRPQLETVLARALAKGPQERYADAHAMRAALRVPGAAPTPTALNVPKQPFGPPPSAPPLVPFPGSPASLTSPALPTAGPVTATPLPPTPGGGGAPSAARRPRVTLALRWLRLLTALALLIVFHTFMAYGSPLGYLLVVLGMLLALPVARRGRRPMGTPMTVAMSLIMFLCLLQPILGPRVTDGFYGWLASLQF